MSRAFFRHTSIVALLVASACSGPSAPSSPAQSKTPVSAAESTVLPPQPGAPAAAAASGGFTFVSSTPASGSEAFMSGPDFGLVLDGFTLDLTVHYSQPLADGKVDVRLYDEGGRECAVSFVDRAIVPAHTIPVRVPRVSWNQTVCTVFPVRIATVKATLVTLRDVGGPFLQRTEYVIATFPLRYTVSRYPPPPGGPDTPPTVSSLQMVISIPIGGAPIPGDPIGLVCTAKEDDGAPVTVRITQRWEGKAPIVHTRAFPAGASSSGAAQFGVGVITPNPPRATIECVVTNDRGQHAVKTMKIPLVP